MLSCRYEITSIDLNHFHALRAIGCVNGRPVIRIDHEDRILLKTIVKSNCLLFEAMELIRAENLRKSAKEQEAQGNLQAAEQFIREAEQLKKDGAPVGHDVTDVFLYDVCIVNWPAHDTELSYNTADGKNDFTADALRKAMLKNGFYIGEQRMLPGLAGAGMTRNGKYLFISEAYHDQAMTRVSLEIMNYTDGTLTLGIDNEHHINAAKLNSYVGLAESDGTSLRELLQIARRTDSAGEWNEDTDNSALIENLFSHERTVLVGDCIPEELTNPLCSIQIANTGGQTDIAVEKAAAADYNLTDGFGLISPRAMTAINRLRKLRKPEEPDHKAIIIRLPFVKGLLVEMDFARYLKEERQVPKINDIFGTEISDLSKVDVILTQSMFKGLTYFGNLPRQAADAPQKTQTREERSEQKKKRGAEGWKEYCRRLKESGLSMIITGTDSAPSKKTHLNTQLLSTVLPDKQSLNKLIWNDLHKQDQLIKLVKGWLPSKAKETEIRPQTDKELKDLAERIIQFLRIEKHKDTDEGEEEHSSEAAAENISYSSILADMIEQNHALVNTRVVREEIQHLMLSRAVDLSSGRITVDGDVRLLVGDPFMLLDSIVDGKKAKIRPLNQEGRCYAPEIDQKELAILRNPHVSPFEDVVLEQIDTEKHKLYADYLSRHHGMIFIPAYAASALAGADYDGDRAQVITSPLYIDLIKEHNKSIWDLLINAEKPKEKEHWLYIPDELKENLTKDMLPPVVINGGKVEMVRVGDYQETARQPQHNLQQKLHYTYLDSINSRVGSYSNMAAAVALAAAFSRSQQTQAERMKNEQTRLWTLATYTILVGLDIDSAKTGIKPTRPGTLSFNKKPALLHFTQSLKDTKREREASFDTKKRFKEYKKALKESGVLPDPKETPLNSLLRKFDVSSYAGYVGGSPLKSILFPKAADKPDSKEAELVNQAAEMLQQNAGSRQLKRALWESREQANQCYDSIRKYLFKRYPASMADGWLRLFHVKPTKKLPKLKTDEDLIRYIFMEPDELRAAFGKQLFGEQTDADNGFCYDSSMLSLIRDLAEYRQTETIWTESMDKLKAQMDQPAAEGKAPVQIGGLKAELTKLTGGSSDQLNRLGMRLLTGKSPVSDAKYVLVFGQEYAASLKKEMKKQC